MYDIYEIIDAIENEKLHKQLSIHIQILDEKCLTN